ncbi:MAG TPA: TylF/MycF/NovP-related O-methyltransferase [Stellaceae bacterium]|nr:TylF/MycF/NovP-related O-methyltransferase [Stellaceae bacterium]
MVLQDYLPAVGGLRRELRGGRSVYEGYQRGWGLEFGELRAKIAEDPDYIEALAAARGRSVAAIDRLMNLFLLIKFFLPRLPHGHIIEYGSFRGGSAFFMGTLAKKFLPRARVFALDTYAGMPATDKSVDAHSAGDFANADYAEVVSARDKLRLDNVDVVKGLFENTAPTVLSGAKSIVLAHIDCDIYSAVKYAYLVSRSHMAPMGYYVFDDSVVSSCIGATEAVEEVVVRGDGLLSEQIFPHHVFRHPAAR